LTQVLRDITGVSGLAIIRAILAGERDPRQLAALRHPGGAEHVNAVEGQEPVVALGEINGNRPTLTTRITCDRSDRKAWPRRVQGAPVAAGKWQDRGSF